jgi:two-component system KDP operon response regulator KdpE
VLVVDDDPGILRAIQHTLDTHGYTVDVTETGRGALAALAHRPVDLVILDLGLPDTDGLSVLRHLREAGDLPVVVLSARGSEADKVRALDQGADDYLTKPFGVQELLARVRVALRHAGRVDALSQPVVRADGLEIDLARRRVTVKGREIHLSPTEWELLKLFVGNPDRVLTQNWLLHRVWGPQYGGQANYLHVFVAGLRKKLEANPSRPRFLVTEPGVGYRFRLDDEVSTPA